MQTASKDTLFLRIRWRESVEYLTIPLPTAGVLRSRFSTIEWRDGHEEPVEYKVHCSAEQRGRSEWFPRITYSETVNAELAAKHSDLLWGTSTIEVDLAAKTAKATFDVKPGLDADWSGAARRCRILDQRVLDSNEAYRLVKQLARPAQGQMREILLRTDRRCAVTEESTADVLDAAHIVDRASSGAQTTANSFLLRADLHRLFGKRLLTIGPNGEFVFHVSAKSYKQYAGKRLPDKVLRRVKAALATTSEG